MKKFFLVVTLFLGYLSARAQRVDVNLIPEVKRSFPILVKYGESFYSFEQDAKGMSGFSANLKRFMHNITLKKYDKEINETAQLKVAGAEKEFGPMEPVLKVANNKLYLLHYKMGKDKTGLFASEVNPNTLEVSASKELLQITEKEKNIQFYMRSVNSYPPHFQVTKTSFTSDVSQPSNSFFFESSPNGSQYVVAWTPVWNNQLYFSVLDKDLSIIRTVKETLPDESALALSNVCIDNKGTVFITYRYNKNDKGSADLVINKATGKSIIKKITIPGSETLGAYAGLNKQGTRLFVCGAYKVGLYMAGVYIQSFNTDNLEADPIAKTPFPKDLIEIIDKEGWGNSKKNGLSDQIIFEANILENDAINLTGEFRRTISGQRASFTEAGSIINARFNGSAVVFTRIPKVRVSAGSTIGDSYKALPYKNDLLIFYNDHISNLNLDVSKTPTRSDVYKNSVLAVAVIGPDGLLKREVVIDESANNYLALVDMMQTFSPDHFFVSLLNIRNLGGTTNNVKWAHLTMQ
jgi:hypothetical protein